MDQLAALVRIDQSEISIMEVDQSEMRSDLSAPSMPRKTERSSAVSKW